jgi:succinoglycan biosynthesis transport protein ExoP
MTETKLADRKTEEEPKSARGVSARVVFNSVRHHPIVFAGVLLVATAVGAGIWFFLPLPKKTGVVFFQVSSQSQSLLAQSENRIDFLAYKQRQMAMVKSRMTLSAALNDPSLKGLPMIVTADPDALTWLDKHLTVDAKAGTELMRLTLEGDDDDQLLAILEAVQRSYLAGLHSQEDGMKTRRQKELEDGLSAAKDELKRHQGKINEITASIGAASNLSFSPDEQMRKDAFLKASAELDLAQQEVDTIEATVKLAESNRDAVVDRERRPAIMAVTGSLRDTYLRQEVVNPGQRLTRAAFEEALRTDATYRAFDQDVSKATQTLKKTEDLFTPGASPPPVVKAREALKVAEARRDDYRIELRERIETEWKERSRELAEMNVTKAQDHLKIAKGHMVRATAKMKAALGVINEADARKIERENLLSEIAQKERYRAAMADEYEKLKLELRAPGRVSLLEPPYVMLGLDGNRRLKYTLLGVLGAFLLGFGALVAWEYRCRRVTRTEEVSTELGMRLIGTIPPLVPDVTGEASPDAHSPLVEAIDTTRIMLTHGSPDSSKLRVLMVTSAVSGEGKTTLSGHLAISLTRAGFRTLLIDGDMQAPSAHVLFDLPASPGLSELLRGESDLTAAIRPSPIPGLSILPAGRWNMSTRQSLVGDRWRKLKRELESKFDFVVIDTSPLLLVSDAMLLARETDGVVLSVLLGVSQIVRVAETVNRLHAIGAPLAGVVVNNVQSEVYQRYMGRSKYALAAVEEIDEAAPLSDSTTPALPAVEEPIAEELVVESGSEVKEG